MTVAATQIRARYAVLAVGVGIAALAALAARADVRAVGGWSAPTVLDLAVGVAYPAAALAAAGRAAQRWWIGAVGAAWLAGSVFAQARSLHQAVLLLGLLAFPVGRISGAARLVVAAPAVMIALEVMPQRAVAAIFIAAAVAAVVALRGTPAAVVYPAAAAGAVAAAVLFAWWAVRRATPMQPVALYDVTLIAVALGFPFASRAIGRSVAHLADDLLIGAHDVGLRGLAAVLADVLHDRQLRIDLWDARMRTYVGLTGGVCSDPGEAHQLEVLIDGKLAARIVTRSAAIADRPTADAVRGVLRLAVANHRLRDVQAHLLADVEASRVRLLAASDRERERAAARLRLGTATSLSQATASLARQAKTSDPRLSVLVERAMTDIAEAAAEVGRIVAGAPPAPLGAGRLRQALETLAGHSTAAVTLIVDELAAADAAAETALFYVCSESLANVAKHAHAGTVAVDLHRQGHYLVLSVRDDGQGGADPDGSGLRGLADRLATAGGRLAVSSPPGEGTTITATVPVVQEAVTARDSWLGRELCPEPESPPRSSGPPPSSRT